MVQLGDWFIVIPAVVLVLVLLGLLGLGDASKNGCREKGKSEEKKWSLA